MQRYFEKIKFFIPIFIGVIFISILFLSFTRWALGTYLLTAEINSEVWEIIIPFIYPLVPILLILRPKYTRLHFKRRDKGFEGFFYLCYISIAAALIASQIFQTSVTKRLEKVTDISEIEHSQADCFQIKQFSVHLPSGVSRTQVKTTGKYNHRLQFELFFLVPMFSEHLDTSISPSEHKIWYALKYQESMSNNASQSEKSKGYQAFIDSSIKKINNHNYHFVNYFESVPPSKNKDNYNLTLDNLPDGKIDLEYKFLQPCTEPFTNRIGNKLIWLICIIFAGILVMLLMLVAPTLVYSDKALKQENKELLEWLKFIIPRGNHFGTSILMITVFLVFLGMLFSGMDFMNPKSEILLKWGGLRRLEVYQGEIWRLITSIFIHAGFGHLLLNLYGLVIAGIFVEPKLGKWRLIILFILSGILASLSSIIWQSASVSVGASGAIFGIYGALLVLLTTDEFHTAEKKSTLLFIAPFVCINLFVGFFSHGIDNAAHIGGLLFGGLIGVFLYSFKNLDET